MWHVSVGGPGASWLAAELALRGVGDASAGEWRERGEIALHLRRRLSAAEAAIVGPVVDVRGTPDGARRVQRMARHVPREWQGVEQ